MKIRTHSACLLALALALVALIPLTGCDQSAKSAPVADQVTNEAPSTTATPSSTSQIAPPPAQTAASDQQLADAQGTVISTPANAAAPDNNPQLGEVVKLVQAGVGDTILMAYVTNSPSGFRLSSDDVVYLNDLGVPQTVINAMLQRDQYFNSVAAQTTAQGPPPAQNGNANMSGYVDVTPAPLPATPDQNTQVVAETAEPPLTPSEDVVDDAEQEPNGAYSYFYDSLSPYGNWININGYGPCWQPTTLGLNPGWQPYCDGGHWVYTDCGWCWVSDYSWGWAPFHYGRWFHSTRFGWCWAPDTVWGPAWVSWRFNSGFCGWAPLPPAACYRPGFGFTFLGRSVGFNFTFGLGAESFVFVPLGHFHDRAWSHSRVDHQEVDRIFRTTTLNNQLIRGPNNTLINRGVPVEQVAAASHMEIHPVHIRTDVEGPRAAQFGRDGRSLSLYRPSLPTPRLTARPTRVGEGVQRDVNFNLQAHVEQAQSRQRQPVNSENFSQQERRPIVSTPPTMTTPNETRTTVPENNSGFSQPTRRSAPVRNQSGVANQWPNYQRGQTFQSQPTAPVDNNRRIYVPQESAPRYVAPQQGQQREWPQQPNSSSSRQEQFRQEQPRQDSRQEQFRQEQPRQETAPRSYEEPRSYESRSSPPAQSESSRQESTQNNNSGNNSGNASGGGGGGRGR